MAFGASVLCPVDFSDSSRGALRYAAAIAAHFGARLTLLVVNDPLLQEADEYTGYKHLNEDTVKDLEQFTAQALPAHAQAPLDRHLRVTTGKPAQEILRISREEHCDMIVMSSHGLTGFRKMFFGSTTERVLRETTVPVLVTPGTDGGPERVEDVRRAVRRVLVPVDLTAATRHQLDVARGVSEALDVPMLLLHVVEPVRATLSAAARLPKVEAERRYRAEQDVQRTLDTIPARIKPETLISYGETAEEIAKVAADRDAGIIVMGLHSSPLLGPRMGSVTYRVLCLAHRLILALPPVSAASEPHRGKDLAVRTPEG